MLDLAREVTSALSYIVGHGFWRLWRVGRAPDEYVAVSYRVPEGGHVFNTFDAALEVYLPVVLKRHRR